MQRLHLEILKRADVQEDRIKLRSWPFPGLAHGPVEFPYRDNLTVIGLNKDTVRRMRDRIVVAFHCAGYEMHEISGVDSSAVVLGTEAGGKHPYSRREGGKTMQVKGALG